MIRFALVVALLVICCCCPAAIAGTEVYELMGFSPGRVGSDATALGDASAAAIGDLVGGTWSAEEKTRNGFVGGVGVHYRKTPLLGIATELDFAVRGTKWDISEPDSGFTLTQTLALNYWEIPLLFVVTPQVDGIVRPTFLAGPYLALLAHSELSLGIQADPNLAGLDLKDVAKSSYFGGVVGAGVEFKTTDKASVLVQARYATAFSNAMKDEFGYEFKPQGFAFYLGLSYGL